MPDFLVDRSEKTILVYSQTAWEYVLSQPLLRKYINETRKWNELSNAEKQELQAFYQANKDYLDSYDIEIV